MTGFLLVNKPAGPTSHDIVARVRNITGEKRVGHAGTLDPFATGLLIVGVGREATREFSKLVGADKRYRAVLRLGATSDTDDRTGAIKNQQLTTKFQREDIEKILKRFTGKIEQVPPMYSAKKINGKKFYELAREGKTIERQPSQVEIFSIEPVEYSLLNTPYSLTLDIHCSSGTYIRALARDIGEALGCGAYLGELERTAIGTFKLEGAVEIDDLTKENIETHLLDINSVIAKTQNPPYHSLP
jgi:tRNA pseudouridine55 synthase